MEQDKQKFHNKHEKHTLKAYNENLLPDRYVLILTNLCNLRCKFCFQKKDPRSDAMTADQWIDFVKQLPSYARVTLCGGEPLAFPDFKKVFSFVAERFDCNMISNGLLLNPKLIDFLLSYPRFKVLSFSIDDIGNNNRGVKPEQWDSFVENVNYFLKRRKELNSKCILDVKTMVLDENADKLFEMYKYFIEEFGADTHAFQFLKGSPIQHADTMFSFEDILKVSKAYEYKNFEQIRQQLEMVRDYNFKNKKDSFLHPKVNLLTGDKSLNNFDVLNEVKLDKTKFKPCMYPWSSVHINVDGTVFPCLAVDVGNVKNQSINEIVNSEEFMKFKNLIKKEGLVEACNRCGWIKLKDNNY